MKKPSVGGITRQDRQRIGKQQANDIRRAKQSGLPLPGGMASRDEQAAHALARMPQSLAAAHDAAAEDAGAQDNFTNFGAQLGLGTDNVASGGSYNFSPITRIRTLLEWIHRGTWIGGMAIDIIADDMTRAGVDLQSKLKPDDAEIIQTTLTQSGSWAGINDTIKWARLYGGCLGVIMIRGQDPQTPLKIESIGEDDYQGILPLDRWMVEASLNRAGIVNDFGPDFGNPKFYTVRNDAPALPMMTVHYSRCIRLEGIRLPYWQRIMENLWGISVIERLYDRMVAFDSATQGASQLVYKSYIRWQKIKGLREIVAVGGKKMKGLVNQIDLTRKYAGIEGVTMMDSEDEAGTFQFSGFAGIAEALLQFAQQISGALQIPLVRLLGQSPAGLNSTGESDLVTYYDGIKQLQERNLRIGMDKVLRCVAMSKRIKLPDNFNFVFSPLWQLSHEKRAEVAERITGTVLAAEERNVISQRKVLTELREQSRVTGVFTNISDDDIEDADDEVGAPSLQELAAAQNPVAGEGGDKNNTFEGGKPPQNPEKLMHGGIGKDTRRRALIDRALPRGEISGIPVIVETPAGQCRWAGQPALEYDYGYVPGAPSAEGEHEWMDAILGDDPESEYAWVVDTYRPDGTFDEHKLMLGFCSVDDATRAYQSVYRDDGVNAAKISAVTLAALKRWLQEGDVMRPFASQSPALRLAS